MCVCVCVCVCVCLYVCLFRVFQLQFFAKIVHTFLNALIFKPLTLFCFTEWTF